jgi:hypothetical protein
MNNLVDNLSYCTVSLDLYNTLNDKPLRIEICCGKKKSKAIPVTGRGGLWGCEMLRIPHYLDNRLTDGGKVVSPTHRPHFTPQKHYL